MRFDAVLHQDRAVGLLRRALSAGRLPHACLFEGPEGVGKEMAARAVAGALLCRAPGRAPADEPCGQCDSCRLLAADTHPDFHLVHRGLYRSHPDKAVQNTKGLFLTIDLVRHFLLAPAANAPLLGRARVFVIRDAERMNDEAQNALLKTLEEPPASAYLILLTTAAGRLLATVRSRCQRFAFEPLPADFVQQELERDGIARPESTALAGMASGRLGAARLWARVKLLDTLPEMRSAVAAAYAHDLEGFSKPIVALAGELAGRIRGREQVADDDDGPEGEPDSDGDSAPKASAKVIPTDELRDGLRLCMLLLGQELRDALAIESGAPRLRRLAPAEHERRGPNTLGSIEALGEAERMLDRNVAPQLVCEWLAAALGGDIRPH